MPQYVFTINGQRHVFEGPDPQTTAQFAQRWATTQAPARPPLVANDNRPQLSPRRSQFAMDAGARAKEDLADLDDAIAQVKAHPTSLMNGPRIVNAVARYVPNAFGLAASAGLDQLTGPVVRGINSRFDAHLDPRGVTDQIMNAAGLLAGTGEMSAAERFERLGGGRLASALGKLREAGVPRYAKPKLTVVPSEPDPAAPSLHNLGQNAEGDNVVPLSEGFMFNHGRRMKSMEDLPKDIQDKYRSAIEDNIVNPIVDDQSYGGHNSTEIGEIRDELAEMANEQRQAGGNTRLADALDAANEDFRIMVNEQQPEMAKELGLTRPGDAAPASSSSAEPDINQTGSRGELASFAQHVGPPETVDDATYDALAELARKWGPERIGAMMKAWKDIGETANDNIPQPNWAGIVKPQEAPIFPAPEDFDLTPLRNTMSLKEKQAWMAMAANDNLLGIEREGAAARRAALNAFSGPASLAKTIASRASNYIRGADFDALLPPEWDLQPPRELALPPPIVAATQPRLDQQSWYSGQPQN